MREGANGTGLIWLRQPPGPPNPKHVLAHLERLKTLRDLRLPDALEHAIHQNRLLKLAREGGQMTAQHLRDLEPARRYATLVAVILDTRATLIDEIIDRHDRFMASLFSKAKRHHADRFQESGKAINDKVRLYSRIGRALIDAKASPAVIRSPPSRRSSRGTYSARASPKPRNWRSGRLRLPRPGRRRLPPAPALHRSCWMHCP